MENAVYTLRNWTGLEIVSSCCRRPRLISRYREMASHIRMITMLAEGLFQPQEEIWLRAQQLEGMACRTRLTVLLAKVPPQPQM